MKLNENLEKHLPFYLTQDAKNHLKKCIKDFNDDNIENKDYYLNTSNENILQGDAIDGFDVVNIPTMEKREILGLVLSNTCDISPSNKRKVPIHITFSPILKLSQYTSVLKNGGISSQACGDMISSIKRQEISNIIYLPYSNQLEDELIILLDNVHSISMKHFYAKKPTRRRFSLSQFGFYMLSFKLSIHFCRLHERTERI